jgi:prepilin-type N-terminal cleavage/methylation domain-containing protein
MRDAGFSLVEVLIATALLAASLAALADLFTISVKNNIAARHGTVATALAAQKIEQLRVDPNLAPSPSDALHVDAVRYVDFVDQYIRRWSIQPVPGSSAFIVQVLVTRRRDRGTADAGAVARGPEDALVITVMRRTP